MRAPSEVDDMGSPNLSYCFRVLSSHMVSLSGYWQSLNDDLQPEGLLKPFSYPGIILEIHDHWFFVTAGHTLQNVDEYLLHPNAQIEDVHLCDHFGPAPVSTKPIPFNYRESTRLRVFDESAGLDYAAIALNSNQVALMLANGVVPVRTENWKRQDEVTYHSYYMLGIPDVFTSGDAHHHILISITEVRDREGLPETTFDRFVGRLHGNVDFDIKGMSGGPIFGFDKTEGAYWVVAIQSTWLPQKGLVFGCRVPVFAKLLQDEYESILAQSTSTATSV